MTKDLAIIKSENVSMIAQNTPQAYRENVLSHDRCIDFGDRLLAIIKQQGMTDDLDRQAALFIEKARKTVKKMNEKRIPLTKIFDEIRREFTTLENDIDPTKAGTVPYQLQQLRNRFAAEKREEEERRRREQLREQQKQQTITQFRADCEEECRRLNNILLNGQANAITELFRNVTLDNFDASQESIKNFPVKLPDGYRPVLALTIPVMLTAEEAAAIVEQARTAVMPAFSQQFSFEMESNRDTFLAMLPGKKQELLKAAQANAEEAERIRQEIAQREAEEAARKEAERKTREQQERQEAELRKKNAEMGNLFCVTQAATPDYRPKTQVKKKLVPLNAEAFEDIFTLWWLNEGKHLSVEELSKLLKKQLTFCEKMANDKTNPQLIKSEHINYCDDVKAK